MAQLAYVAVGAVPRVLPSRRADDLPVRMQSRLKDIALLREAEGHLRSKEVQHRMSGRSTMLEIALRETVPEVLPTLMDNCTTALNSSDFDERDNARGILTRLAMKGHEGAKSALESGFMAAIADFSLDALVFLGNYARPNIASAVDTSLEHNMERLVKEGHLNTLTYIAGKSSCSIDARRRAARILGKEERRVENLKYVESHTLDLEIRAIMRAAIEDRQR